MTATAGERLRAQNRALVALARSDALRGHDLKAAARALTRCTSDTLGVARVGIWQLDKSRRKLRAVDIYLASKNGHSEGEELSLSDYATYFAALAEERTIAAPDAAGDARTAEFAGGYFEAHGIGAVLDAALRVNGELVGVLWCEHLGGRRAWTPDEQAFAAAVADLFVHAMQARNRRTVEQALQRQQSDFMAVIEHASDLVTVVDEEGIIRYQSPSAHRWLGYRQDEVVGRPAAEFTHPDDLETAGMSMATLLNGRGRITRVESRIRHKNGGWRKLETAGHVLAGFHEGRRAVVLIARDVTERSAAEQDLRDREAYFHALLEGATDIIAVVEQDSTLAYVNAAAKRLLGYAPDEVIGRPISAFFPRKQRQRMLSILSRGIGRPERQFRYVFRLRHRDGDWRQFDVQGRPLPEAPGAPAALVVARDVTQRREAEQQLQERETQLHHAQKMEAVGRLAGGVAHDFNNLLQAIGGYAELLGRSRGLDEQARARVDGIRGAVQRATMLTRQLLAFSRRQVLQPSVLDLNAVVGELAGPNGLASRLVGEDISITLDRATQPIMAKADRGQLEQVLMNLVVNARDAMPDGGELRFSTDVITLGEPIVPEIASTLRPGRYARIVVSDNGCGMDGATRVHALEPFFTTKARGKGTGLGLSTAFGIITQSGGDLRITSQVSRGTAMEVLLPSVAVASPTPTPEQSGKGWSGRSPRGETILVVEDDIAVRELATELLRTEGYVVRQADSGPGALTLLRAMASPPRLLVTDVVMPGMNGRELAEAAVAAVPGLRVLFLSGYGHDVVARHGVLEEGTRLLAKPFSAEELHRAVREAIHAPAEPPGVTAP